MRRANVRSATRMRAACAIAAAATAPNPKPLLAIAERHARELERERHYSVIANIAKAELLRAGIAATRGNEATALDYLSLAIDRFQECGSAFWHALALRRKGQVLGGSEGLALVRQADEWMAREHIVNPAAMTAAFIPGFPVCGEIRHTLEIRTPLGMRAPIPSPDTP